MKKMVLLAAVGVLLVVSAPMLLAVSALSALSPGGGSSPGPDSILGRIPPPMLSLYQQAATICPGLSWSVLAAIGTVESANGQSNLPGVHSGHNAAGAEGPMQFEPPTFARYDQPSPPGGVNPPSPYDPVDAVYAAARMLCSDGAGQDARLRQAIFAYNHSDAYVNQVVLLADQLEGASADQPGLAGSVAFATPAAVAVAFALTQVGTPYRWGGESPGVGFDCSGLAQAAWLAAGVRLPRVAADQFAAGPLLPPGAALQAGDLVFFGPRFGGVTHVGLVVDPTGQMVDAPHTGAFVRVESFPLALGAAWGSDIFDGASRPAAGSLG